MGEVTTEELATLQREFDWLLSQEVLRLVEQTNHCFCQCFNVSWSSLHYNGKNIHVLRSVMSPPGSRCVDTVEGSGHRVCVQVPCAGTSSQNLFCIRVHNIDSFGHCSIPSKSTFIGRTSKCRTTKLLRQICSHHNRPDEGTLQQSSREFHFELSILSILLRSGKI